MRIAQLQLMAYGPFRGLELDFSAPGIHVVFGRNEAGKSTTLRAITGLLYGIEVHTPDAHLHKPADLRIGGMLVADDGSRLRVVRRKGASKTLLDESGQAIDDALLQRLLRGVSESTFKNAFGLDLKMLQQGAKSLLEGKGDVGGSLFDASVGGGADARKLLEQLENEADAIYKPRGTTLPLNDALKAFADATKAIKETQRLPEAYVLQEKVLEEGREARALLATQKAKLVERRDFIVRARSRVPVERKRALAAAVVSELGHLARASARLASLEAKIAAYDRDVAAHRKDTTESERLRDRVAEASRRAGVPVDSKTVRTDERTQVRIQKHLDDRAKLTERLESSRVELERAERELARLRANMPTSDLADAAAIAALERASGAAMKLGDLAGRITKDSTRTARVRAELEAKVAAIPWFRGTLEELVTLRMPSDGALEALAKRAAAAERSVERHEDEVSALDRSMAALHQELAAASGDFAPPTKTELAAVRTARDDAWTRLREATAGSNDPTGAKTMPLLTSAYERAVRDADELADRMIREADRVTALARLRSQETAFAEQHATAVAERTKAIAECAAAGEAHHTLWATAGITPPAGQSLGIAEMRAWLVKHAQIADGYAALREAELDAAESVRTIEATRSQLAAALSAVDGATKSTKAAKNDGALSLVDLLDLATARLARINDARRSANDASAAITKLEGQIEDRRASAKGDEAKLEEARTRLAELIAPLGIPNDAEAAEVTRSLETLRVLFDLEDDRADVEVRAKAALAEAKAFEEEAARAATELAPELATMTAVDLVSELAARCEKAVAAERAIAEADERLAELEGAPIPEDITALASDPDAASRAIDDAEAEIAELERDISKADQTIGGQEMGLQEMRGETGAAEQAAVAQEALERVRSSVERFVRARVGGVILRREIDRYREENQGPLLTTASQLFARLTLGGFTGVRVGYNDKDKPALMCVRPGNVECEIDGLSEGTRDQLYFSLRVASLLRYADVAEPMPLVLDDILIQFDDDRSRAALEILAELSSRIQVLFFTHHTKLVDLARASLPAASLHVHELASRETVVTAPSPPP